MFNATVGLEDSTAVVSSPTETDGISLISTTSSTGLEEDLYTNYPEYHVSQWLLLVYRPACAILGMTGNTLCVLVVMTTSLRHSPTAVYMVTLAALDWVVSLYAGLTVLPKDFFIGEQRFFTSSWHCQAYYFTFLFVVHFDTLTLVSMTAQRYVAVTFPLHAARWNSRRGVTLTLAVAAVVAFLANVIHLITFRLQSFDGSYRGRCSTGSGFGHYFQMRVYPWIDSVLYFFFPTVTIGVLNVLIFNAVKRADSFKAQAATSSQQPKNGSVVSATSSQRHSHPRSLSQRGYPEFFSGTRNSSIKIDGEAHNTGDRTGSAHPSLNYSGERHSRTERVKQNGSEESGVLFDGDGPRVHLDLRSVDTRPRLASNVTRNTSSRQAAVSTTPTSSSAQLTRMLLTVSVAFLVLTLPLGVFIVLFRYWNPTSGYQKAQFSLIRDLTESLMFTNHAINFLLYCLSGRRFRNKVTSLICRACRTCQPVGLRSRSQDERSRSDVWTSDLRTEANSTVLSTNYS